MTRGQRTKLLDAVRADPQIGTVAAARAAGVKGTRGQLREQIQADEELTGELREARGWSLENVEHTCWMVAQNPSHPSWDRANSRILRAYHPLYQEAATLTVSGPHGGPIEIEDRSATLADVARVLEAVGALAGIGGGAARPALPAPPDLLAEPRQG